MIWEGDIMGGAVLLYDWSKSPLGNMDFYVLGKAYKLGHESYAAAVETRVQTHVAFINRDAHF